MRRIAHQLASPVRIGAAVSVLAAAVLAGLPHSAEAAADSGLGTVTSFTKTGDATYTIETEGGAKVRLDFLKNDEFRIWMAPDGKFTDPAGTPPADPKQPNATIVVKQDFPAPPTTSRETGDGYEVATGDITVRVAKSPALFEVRRADGSLVWKESKPLTWNANGTTQTLARGAAEQFFGGGMQNGRFSHRDQTINVGANYNWEDGGYPNSSPFYLTTAGYGVLRNTFTAGTYSFGEQVTATQKEQRFDAYYFVSPKQTDLYTPIDRYTELTGRPFMPPIYGLEMGDADCYLHNANRGERKPEDAVKVAQGYVDHDMPRGWMLVNDGYGCGYDKLPWVGDELRDRNVQLGLWTQSALTNQEYEVKDAGVRVRKLDVAWVGPGYRHALTGCEDAYQGIEKNSDARGYVWMVEGWAGAQRCAVQWTGDHSGSLDSIRWQVPALAGSGMSGIAYTAGDIDGIFGGSDVSYVRDLQWKVFTPALMSMSGWAGKDKQPWVRGEPYTSINRAYLRLRERLLPYFYTYAAQAHRTGAPIARPLVLEYPEDADTWGDKARYQFLAGKDFLVAPVYTAGEVRDGIYLPKGTWVDYWTGRTYEGPTTVNGYHAPLDRLPLFVRGGAIVPMWKDGINNHADVKPGDAITLDVYPKGNSIFELYEDDGVTRQYAEGRSATQTFTVTAPEEGRGEVTVAIGALTGEYDGKAAARPYELVVHGEKKPGSVHVGGKLAQEVGKDAYAAGAIGWYHDENGVTRVRTAAVPTGEEIAVKLAGASAVGGRHPSDTGVTVSASAPRMILPGQEAEVTFTVANGAEVPVKDVVLSVAVPEGWAAVAPWKARKIEPGTTATAKVRLAVPEKAVPGPVTLTASAAYTARADRHESTAAFATEVPYGSLAAAFDNVGISDDANTGAGNLDGGGSSFSAQKLAAIGVTPGSRRTVEGVEFTWPSSTPGTPDNVVAAGQTIALSGKGSGLAFLGTEAGNVSRPVTVVYADGSTDSGTLGFPNWCCAATDTFGAKVAFSVKGKNTTAGPNQYPTTDYRIFFNSIRINPDKEVIAVKLPDAAAIHIFAMALGDKPLPPAPKGTVYASDLTPLESVNGWGPVEKDRSNGESGAGDGRTISLAGTTYAKGLGVHAYSKVTYYLGKACTRFTSVMGVDDETRGNGSVTFKVIADGTVVHTSGRLTGTTPPETLDVDVTGARIVDLEVNDSGDGNGADHADWADAKFVCAS
ncbi:NPCBM/NEW2 domain-containing protein [Microtetraspora fusca]|uniref:NPCBM/NEW2 domain-containing protein n=1 Tax=Microtetraspora fusca TaxID=1997 RepID=UPI000AE66BE5|nr:NPCBM/NEW2 domain-containing protein [Microtetraspora fusca]